MKTSREMAVNVLRRAAEERAAAAMKRRRLAVGVPVSGACLMFLLGFGAWRFVRLPSRIATSDIQPTAEPTVTPTTAPTATPTANPTVTPTATPTANPTVTPTAVPDRVSDGTFTYEKTEEGTYRIVYVEFLEAEAITLPTSYQDIPVTAIGADAFKSYTMDDAPLDEKLNLKKVTVPQGVTTLESRAFYNCSNLTTVSLPDSLREIGDHAFSGCNSLTIVRIPHGVRAIGDYTFSGCYSLTTVSLPDSVREIGDYAFSGCYNLTTVSLPDSVRAIGDYAFSECDHLTTVSLPDSLREIGDCAFSGCDSLTTVSIPDGVQTLNEYVFSGCDSLKRLKLPATITEIKAGAFNSCSKLKNIDFDGTVAQWNSIVKGEDWAKNSGWFIVHCTDGEARRPEAPGKENNVANFASVYRDTSSGGWQTGDSINLLFRQSYTVDRILVYSHALDSPKDGGYTIYLQTEDDGWRAVDYTCERSFSDKRNRDGSPTYALDELTFAPVEHVVAFKLVFRKSFDPLTTLSGPAIKEIEVYEVP